MYWLRWHYQKTLQGHCTELNEETEVPVVGSHSYTVQYNHNHLDSLSNDDRKSSVFC